MVAAASKPEMFVPHHKHAYKLYDLLWKIAIPFLKHNRRLADGFSQRLFETSRPEKADIWIQAASVGEAFLAIDLVERLRPERDVSVLLTTNTLQGKSIFERNQTAFSNNPRIKRTQTAFFPFDRPAVMRRAVQHIRPALMILLEAEIWPAHLAALKQMGTPIVVVNGRLSAKSLKRYRYFPTLWYRTAPDRILAMSAADARRFAVLFGPDRVEVIHNLKFDRLDFKPPTVESFNPLKPLFPSDSKILVLGSVRREEEVNVNRMISLVRSLCPHTVICLFPRHVQRLHTWTALLDRQGKPWTLRSRIVGAVEPGSVVLWDTFGELVYAYELCQAAFVGGSLAPLGGQNFLEAMASGVVPVIGPHWDNFAWVGKEVVTKGLIRVAADWRQAAELLAANLRETPVREKVRHAALGFVKEAYLQITSFHQAEPPENLKRNLNSRWEGI